MVEQLAVNQRVVSSSLTLPASKNYSCKCAVSSVGQSRGLLIPRSRVRIPDGAPCGIGVMVAYRPSKPLVRVRISYAAPCLVRLMVRTQPSQGCNTSSTLVRDTIFLIIEYCECGGIRIGSRRKSQKLLVKYPIWVRIPCTALAVFD